MDAKEAESELKQLQALGLNDLLRLLRDHKRQEADGIGENGKGMQELMDRLRRTLLRDPGLGLREVLKTSRALATVERIETTRLRCLILDGKVPLDAEPAAAALLQDKLMITKAPRKVLLTAAKAAVMNLEYREAVLDAVAEQPQDIAVGDKVMFTIQPDRQAMRGARRNSSICALVEWARGTVAAVDPFLVLPDASDGGHPIKVLEVCPEETYHAAEIKRAFCSADANGDGVLTCEELNHVLGALGFRKSEREMNMIFSAMDSDKNGHIDYNEFVDWLMGEETIKEVVLDSDWIENVKAPVADAVGKAPELNMLHTCGMMQGPGGLMILGKQNSVADEWNLLANSKACIKNEKGVVGGFSFVVHGKNFRIGFASSRRRWAGTEAMDFGLRLDATIDEPGVQKNDINITEHGKLVKESCGTTMSGGRSTLSVEVNARGQVEYRHNDQLLHTSSQAPAFPLFLKIFALKNGPVLQRLQWLPPRS